MDVACLLRGHFPTTADIPGANLTSREVSTIAWSPPDGNNAAHGAYDCICAFLLTTGLAPTFDVSVEGIDEAIANWANQYGFSRHQVWPLGLPDSAALPNLFTTKAK